MPSEHQEKIDQLFEKAVELDPESRKLYLDRECVNLPDSVRDEVEALIAADGTHKSDTQTFFQAAQMNLAEMLPSSVPIDEMIGQQVGRFEIKKKIATGGFGNVYLAVRNDEFQQKVAIKIIRSDHGDNENILRRFEMERQVLSDLDHPLIARLIDGGSSSDGRPYFAMEYVDGKTITDYCESKKLNIDERLRLFQQVCQAVAHAHQFSVIHRDIKPSNILVTEEGTPKLLDFGIAKLTDLRSQRRMIALTETGQLPMTPDYASPEQLMGKPIGQSSDVFSLGVVAYELLTGARPFRVESGLHHEFVQVVCNQEANKPSTSVSNTKNRSTTLDSKYLRKKLAGDIDNIVLMALRKEPERRYQSANELVSDLDRYFQNLPVDARRGNLSYAVSKFVRRHFVGVAALSAVLLALTLGLLATAISLQKANLAQAEAEKQVAITTVARLASESSASRKGRPIRSVLLAIKAVEMSRQIGQEMQPAAHAALLNSFHGVRGMPLRGHNTPVTAMAMSQDWLITGTQSGAFIWDLNAKEPATTSKRFGSNLGDITSLAVSDDGRWLITAGTELARWDLSRANTEAVPLVLKSQGGQINVIKFTEDGRWLVAQGTNGSVELWDFASASPATSRELNHSGKPFHQLAISSNGRWLAGFSWDAAWMFDLNDAQGLSSSLLLKERVLGLSISPDGHWLVVVSPRKIRLWDLTCDHPERQPPQEFAVNPLLEYPFISSDSRWLYTTENYSPRIWRWDLRSPQPFSSPSIFTGQKDAVGSVEISQNGRWLVSGSRDGTAMTWDLESSDPTVCVETLRAHDTFVDHVAIHPDGHWIATASRDGTSRLWDLNAADPASSPFVLRGNGNDIFSTSAISSDGRLIATATEGDNIRLWSIDSDTIIKASRILRSHSDRITSMEISPNDQWLVTTNVDKTANLWDLTKPDIAATHTELKLSAKSNGLAINPSSELLALGCNDGNVYLFDLTKPDPNSSRRILRAHKSAVDVAVISRDGRWLVSGCDYQTIRWDLNSKNDVLPSQVLRSTSERSANFSMAIDAASRQLAVTQADEVWIWDLAAGVNKKPRIISRGGSSNIWRLAISPDGRWLFTSGFDHQAELWDLNTSQPKRLELHGHRGVQEVAISPDGHWMVTGGPLNAQLWDLTAPDPASTMRMLMGHDAPIWSVRISSDSRWLITDSSDGTIRRWNLDLEWLLEHARTAAGRELTDEENRLFQLDTNL